jgi:hypothetical protein
VADAVVQGKTAEGLLDPYAKNSGACPACGATADGNEACTSCGAAVPAGTVQRSPLSGPGSHDKAAESQVPRSLNKTLAPQALSDDEITAELGAIRAWFDAQSTSSQESESLALAAGQLAHELVQRHPGPSIPATAPRPAGSITPADVRRANAGALSGVMGVGAGMAVPGLSPMPLPMPMPPAMPMPMPPPTQMPVPPAMPVPPVAPPAPIPPVATAQANTRISDRSRRAGIPRRPVVAERYDRRQRRGTTEARRVRTETTAANTQSSARRRYWILAGTGTGPGADACSALR